ncbi:hypothetical protein [Brevundimonas sp.]
MKRTAATLLCLIALSACGERPDTAAPAATAPAAPAVPAVVPSPVAAPADLEASCRQAVLRLAGQEGDTVQFRAQGTKTATMSWRAPVDGGRQTMTCTVSANGVELATDVGQMSVDASTVPAASAAQEEAR